MTMEQPQQFGFSESQKEAALRKTKTMRMRMELQNLLMSELGFGLTGEKESDNRNLHEWINSDSSKDFRIAFDKTFLEHPDLLDIYENNASEAFDLVRKEFEQLHQHA